MLRTIQDTEDLIQPLENAIHHHLISALIERPLRVSAERDLLALPVRLGGLGPHDPSAMSPESRLSSETVAAPPVELLISQQAKETVGRIMTYATKKKIKKNNQFKEKGFSSWLPVLPLKDHGFFLHKGELRDALSLRYGWKTINVLEPVTVVLSSQNTEIRDITASFLTKVCDKVAILSHLYNQLAGKLD